VANADGKPNYSMESSSNSFAALHPQEQKRLLEKLAKLTALSSCPTGNVNETATAAAATARIRREYEIEMADLDCGPRISPLMAPSPLVASRAGKGIC